MCLDGELHLQIWQPALQPRKFCIITTWLLSGIRVERDSKEDLGFLQSRSIHGFILMIWEVLDCLLLILSSRAFFMEMVPIASFSFHVLSRTAAWQLGMLGIIFVFYHSR